MLAKLVIGAILVGLSGVPAAADLFLNVDDIPGGSVDPAHEDWIDLESFGIGVSRAVDSRGRVIGDPQFSPLQVEGHVGPASVPLFETLLEGTILNVVTLDITQRIAGSGSDEVIATWKLENVYVTSYSTSGDADGDILPSEHYAFGGFGRITYRYNNINPLTGEAKGHAEYQWDAFTGVASLNTVGTVDDFRFITGSLVPEPGTAALLGLASLGLLRKRRCTTR